MEMRVPKANPLVHVVTAVALASLVGACAAAAKSAEPAKSADAQNAPAQAGYPPGPAGQGQQPASPPEAGYPDTSSPAPPAAPPPPPADAPSRSYAEPPGRAAALTQASNDIEASQRELDVAGGDCANACRALGSMDRAAGRLCGLAQSNDDQRRCEGAKARVYSARYKVKNTCGSCPGVSVEKSAPIPSR
jgi:hypothetical protein